jgi:hypothetical protein
MIQHLKTSIAYHKSINKTLISENYFNGLQKVAFTQQPPWLCN